MVLLTARKTVHQLILFFILLISSTGAIAQLNADFSANQTGGCSPLTVSFTNKTTGASSNVTYQWDLGNGNTSSINNPGGTYREEKTYTVTLTAKDGSQTSTKTLQITVYKKPTVDFTASIVKGCAPLPVDFVSNSTAGDGTISSYFWDFSDGSTQKVTTPQINHVYTFAQKASVSLTVTNSYGCFSTSQKPDLVEVLPGIKPTFTPDKTTLCNVSEAVKFTNTSTGPSDITYAWDFGDGNTSTAQSPSYTYNKKGSFPVKLTVSSASGCSASTSGTINVANFTSDFDVPSPLCQNTQLTFVNKSSPAPASSTWAVDNNSYASSYSSSFSTSFYNSGPHTIKLTNTYGTCQDVVTKPITINSAPVLNGFVANLGGSCGAPVTVQFKDTSASAVRWLWSFNYSSNTSNIKEPSYTYTSEGYNTVQLTITDANGCTATRSQSVNVFKPNINISVIKSSGLYSNSGCTNLTATFAASPASDIKDYNWDFGDGTTGNTAQPQHTFAKVGTYTVKLNYTTNSGCQGVATYYNAVSVYSKPVVDFTASQTTVCGNTPVVFTVTSSTNNFGSNWYWSFGDNQNYNYYNYGNGLGHQYFKDSVYTVSLITSNYGCSDTITKKNYITVLPPFPKIASETNTCNGTRGLVTFTDASKKSLAGAWDFGDGSTQSFTPGQATINHTYTKTGSYKVVLTTTNDQCSVRDSITAYVLLKQSPLLTATQTEICGSDKLNFQLSNFEVNTYPYSYSYNSYYYISRIEYGDQTKFTGNTYNNSYYWTTNYSGTVDQLVAGQKDLRIITTSSYFSCADTSNYVPLKIKGPVANFKVTTNNVCYKSPNIFSDSSKVSSNVPIKKWEWNYGDGVTESFTTRSNASHIYANPGQFYATLKVTDADGCTATTPSYTTSATVNGPKASFYYTPTNVSPNTTVYFYNSSNSYNSYSSQYTWKFGDGTTSTNSYPSKLYTKLGTDTVKLIAKNPTTGCTDTAVQVINVKNFNASFTYTSSYINNNSCPPVVVRFTNTSVNARTVSWNFGDGGKADNQNNPSHTYYNPGVYYVTIYITGDNNSKDSTTDSITVKGPYAKIKSDILQGCGSQTVTLTAEVKNASSYTWDFADGTLKDTKDTFAVYKYTTPGVYTPSLILKDGSGCPGTSTMKDPIVIDTLNIKISSTPSHICDSAQVQFTPAIKSLAADQLHETLKYEWNFGTGNIADTSDVSSPYFTFVKRTKYPVTLKVTSPYGCVKQAIDTVEVFQRAKAIISGPPQICESTTATFTGSSDVTNVKWKWNFNNGSTSTVQNPGKQLYNAPGVYDVQLIVDNAGCYDTATSKLTVNPKPAINLSPKQPTICLGKSVQLTSGGGTTYVWTNVGGLNNYAVANPIASPVKTSQYNVEVTNSFGCKNTDSVVVNVAQPFKISSLPDTSVCIGNRLQLKADGGASFKWINNTAGINNTQIASPVASPGTSTIYTVVGYDAYQCFTDTASFKVTVASYPSVSAGPDQQVFTGATIQLQANASSDVVRYKWSPADYLSCINCATPVSTPKNNISYIVTATNKYGCSTADTVSIKLLCDQSHVYIPTAFTPNGDYKNDGFYIKGGGVKMIKFIKIFNRSGEAIFEKTNFNIDDPSSAWNGKYNGYDLPSGAYVYFTEMVCDTGETFSYKGTLMLIR